MAEDLVMVRVFDNEVEAEIARGELEASGIRAVILKDDAGGMYPFLQGAGGVRLMVSADESERAEEILESGTD